jgi:hypothetical protein
MTLEELSALDPDLLAAALEAAKQREIAKRLDTLPKCRCGSLATQIIMPQVIYRHMTVHHDEVGYVYTAYVGRSSAYGDLCPGEDPPDDGMVWVCCDDAKCLDSAWKSMRYGAVSTAVRGL